MTNPDINAGTADAPNIVNPVAIATDGATVTGDNVFTSHKTFSNDVIASSATIARLENVQRINDIDVVDYRAKVLVTEGETEQVITGEWSLDSGMVVDGQMDVHGTIDGVSVNDLVLRDVVDSREIPEVTFADDVLVLGDVITTGTDFQAELDSFLNEVIKPSSDGTIENNLRFTGAVTIDADVNIGTLNGIPSDTWVISGSDTPQNIAVKTVFTQDTLTVHGDLVSDDIDGVDLSAKYADAVKINEDCVFAGPRLVFQAETELSGEKLSGNLPEKVNTTLAELMGNLRRFVTNLHDFHRDHIDVVVPALDEEIRVAQRLELGVATYLDTSALPAHLQALHSSQVSRINSSTNLYISCPERHPGLHGGVRVLAGAGPRVLAGQPPVPQPRAVLLGRGLPLLWLRPRLAPRHRAARRLQPEGLQLQVGQIAVSCLFKLSFGQIFFAWSIIVMLLLSVNYIIVYSVCQPGQRRVQRDERRGEQQRGVRERGGQRGPRGGGRHDQRHRRHGHAPPQPRHRGRRHAASGEQPIPL